ncbi:MAG: stage II sporulation protein M [Nanoarchaeota archaeon]|nr:stage II sporulation protein M [Nanoarchaeota archaeon]MBU4086062.1 stage II sporulation protein M [Nanoarchaeota archaeon]
MIIKLYKQAWNFLREIKKYIYFIAILFLVSGVLGIAYPLLFADIIQKLIEDVVSKTEGMGFLSLFWFIFQNNSSTAFIGVLLGILVGIAPVLLCFFNGYVLGFVLNKSSSLGFFGILARIVPHGVFELPALVISLALGLKLGLYLFMKKDKKKGFLYVAEKSLKVFLLVVLPLLLVAAFIETCLMFLFR